LQGLFLNVFAASYSRKKNLELDRFLGCTAVESRCVIEPERYYRSATALDREIVCCLVGGDEEVIPISNLYCERASVHSKSDPVKHCDGLVMTTKNKTTTDRNEDHDLFNSQNKSLFGSKL
jgi:hypothetical protein